MRFWDKQGGMAILHADAAPSASCDGTENHSSMRRGAYCPIRVEPVGGSSDISGGSTSKEGGKVPSFAFMRPRATIWGGHRFAPLRRPRSFAGIARALVHNTTEIQSCHRNGTEDLEGGSPSSEDGSEPRKHDSWSGPGEEGASDTDGGWSGEDTLEELNWDEMSFWGCRKRSGEGDVNERSTKRCIWQSNHLPPPFLSFERLGIEDNHLDDDEEEDLERIEGSDFSFLALPVRVPPSSMPKLGVVSVQF